MTDATSPVRDGPQRNSPLNLMLALGGIALLCGLFFLAQVSKSVSLNRSAIGFDALPLWLEDHEIDARTFYGRAVLEPETVRLRILPLYDVDLRNDASDTNDEKPALEETERDVPAYVLDRKIERLPTLVVMPKWRRGVRELGVIHPDLLIGEGSAKTISEQFYGIIGTLRNNAEAAEVTGPLPLGRRYTLHYPQVLENSPCTPILGTRNSLLLGECSDDGVVYWVLADPDLLNNHGLSQGDNAEAVLSWLPALREGDGDIILDLTAELWVRRAGGRDAEQRSWKDLSRFFEYPFSIIWWSFALLGALTLWRSWRRYGPADARSEEEKGPRASRMVSIDTKARLLRLTGRDDALVRAHIDARLEALADDVLGPQRARGAPGLDRLIAAITRRAPPLAAELERLRDAGTSVTAAPETLMHHVAQFDALIERILDEFGRTGRAR